MRICRRCGVYAPPDGGVCDGCGTDLRTAARDAAAPPQRFAAVRLERACPSCGQWTPVTGLAITEPVPCLRCGALTALPEKAWRKVLDRAHAVADLFGEHPEGREPSGVAIDAVNPFAEAARRRSGVRLAPDEAEAWRGWLPDDVRAWIAPGLPLGSDSFEPMQVRHEGPGVLHTRTSRGESARYVVDVRAVGLHRALLGVIADEHRADRAEPDLLLERTMHVRCPACASPVGLDGQLSLVRCESCGALAHVPVVARLRAQADPKPDTWWVVFDGPSPYRRFLERHPSTWEEPYGDERPLERGGTGGGSRRLVDVLYVALVPTLLLAAIGVLSRLPLMAAWLERLVGGYP